MGGHRPRPEDIQRLSQGIRQAFEALDCSVPVEEVKGMARLVASSMTGPNNVYHAMSHVFDVVPEKPEQDPLAYLAAVFHDIVYLQVDGCISPAFLPILQRARLLPVPTAEGLAAVHAACSNFRARTRTNDSSSCSALPQPMAAQPALLTSEGIRKRIHALSNPGHLALMAGQNLPDGHAVKGTNNKQQTQVHTTAIDTEETAAIMPCHTTRAALKTTAISRQPSIDSRDTEECKDSTESIASCDSGVSSSRPRPPGSLTATTSTATPDRQRRGSLRVQDSPAVMTTLKAVEAWRRSTTYVVSDDHMRLPHPDPSVAQVQKRALAQQLCYSIFGHTPGKLLPFAIGTLGLNEFLSCVIAMDVLAPWLTEAQLLHVCVCIEATIPFRPSNCTTTLHGRCLHAATHQLHLPREQEHTAVRLTKHMVESACEMTARDVGNFALADTRGFLANTWKLLPELNMALRNTATFTLKDWMGAMAGNWGFFRFLLRDPAVIFPRFGHCCTDEKRQQMVARAVRNLQRGRTYIGARLLSASIMHAVLSHRHAHVMRLDDMMDALASAPVGMLFGGDCTQGGLLACQGPCLCPTCATCATVTQATSQQQQQQQGRAEFDFGDESMSRDVYVQALLRHGFDGKYNGQAVAFSSTCSLSASIFQYLHDSNTGWTRYLQVEQREEGEGNEMMDSMWPRQVPVTFEECVQSSVEYHRGDLDATAFLLQLPDAVVQLAQQHLRAHLTVWVV
ncbi:hypothetical protein PTSG_05136 [Salpingoeca rosetta]|uniref:Uncharacterized protein n=1 Tax=Salpingoeca rosetta (strain ATCC 50818 / BSB-021) TaxID=946362 RepID=F2UAL7_SALR5|nr:uncharacterized protein PTSG_05136 [Salpingoeca rosetta]EGD73433.1 hypothetical protein PTSG_05136 [Salpingoeca rosetta]|eukprot:XP_004993715.1 hypothetical protein PTSG_05136 [Salpingoeca rosetta]